MSAVEKLVTIEQKKFRRLRCLTVENQLGEDIRVLEIDGRIPIKASDSEIFTGLSERAMRDMLKDGRLSPYEINGQPRTVTRRGRGFPICFDLNEWLDYER